MLLNQSLHDKSIPHLGSEYFAAVPMQDFVQTEVAHHGGDDRPVPETASTTAHASEVGQQQSAGTPRGIRCEERHMSLASYALEVLTRHVQSKTMSQVLGGPRLRKGKALSNDDVLELLASGRR